MDQGQGGQEWPGQARPGTLARQGSRARGKSCFRHLGPAVPDDLRGWQAEKNGVDGRRRAWTGSHAQLYDGEDGTWTHTSRGCGISSVPDASPARRFLPSACAYTNTYASRPARPASRSSETPVLRPAAGPLHGVPLPGQLAPDGFSGTWEAGHENSAKTRRDVAKLLSSLLLAAELRDRGIEGIEGIEGIDASWALREPMPKTRRTCTLALALEPHDEFRLNRRTALQHPNKPSRTLDVLGQRLYSE